jgi:integrase
MQESTLPAGRQSLKLEKTATPGVYRRHAASCSRKGKCSCPYVVVTRHRGKQVKTFHRTLELAREAKSDRTRTGRQAPHSRRPFDEYAREWIAHFQGRTRRGFDEDTRKGYAAALEAHAIPHFGATQLRNIERKDVRALVTKLQRQGLSPRSIAAYLAPVRAMFSDAVDDGDMAANPAVKLAINAKARGDAPATEPERAKTMTRAELSAVLAAVPEQHRLIFEVMAGTGCRISEALGLEWRDLGDGGTTLRIERQWYRGTLKPNTKTEAGARTVDLSPELARKLWERGADATGPMFQTRTGQRPNDRNLRRILDTAAKKAGVFGISHHTFRHTHGSLLLDEGWSIPEVSERLGHADPAITAAVYSHRMPDRKRDLGFLDLNSKAVVGNNWATQGPETAANAAAVSANDSSD